LIKIDVEGHELSCLRGLQPVLERDRPLLFVEVSAYRQRQLLDLLEPLGYGVVEAYSHYVGMTNWLLQAANHQQSNGES